MAGFTIKCLLDFFHISRKDGLTFLFPFGKGNNI